MAQKSRLYSEIADGVCMHACVYMCACMCVHVDGGNVIYLHIFNTLTLLPFRS